MDAPNFICRRCDAPATSTDAMWAAYDKLSGPHSQYGSADRLQREEVVVLALVTIADCLSALVDRRDRRREEP